MQIFKLVIIIILVQSSVYAIDSTLIKLKYDEHYFGKHSFFVFLNGKSTSKQFHSNKMDSMNTQIEKRPILSIGPMDIYELPESRFAIDSTLNWEKYIAELETNTRMNRASQVVRIPEIENLFHDLFYKYRKINSEKNILLESGYRNQNIVQNNISVKISELNNIDSYNTAQLKIVGLPNQGIEEIHFVFKPVVSKMLTTSEYLVLEYFLYYFFKTNLVKSNNKFRIQFSPIERLSKIEIPEYLPLVSIQMHSNYSERLIAQWPQIYRVLLNFIQVKNLEAAKNELNDHILFELSSTIPRLIFSGKLALLTGRWTPLSDFENELDQIDLEALKVKAEKVILQQLFYIFWFTDKKFDEKIVKNIDSSIKFEIISF